MSKYTETKFVTDHPDMYIRVRYYRHGIRGYKWATHASIHRRSDNSQIIDQWSYCHERDNPNRKIGRAIAVGRAIKFATLAGLVA